jgi:hypothetical protein
MSGSGGGGAGKNEWPDYMQTRHTTYLDAVNVLVLASIAAANPYSTATPYNPATDLTAMATAITNYGTANATFDTAVTTFDTYIGSFSTTYIAAAITAYLADILSDINTIEIPVFEAGMSTINAVQSSSFAIGEALIIAKATKQAAKEGAILYDRAASVVSSGKQAVMEGRRAVAGGEKDIMTMTLEYRRASIVAKSEEATKLLEINVHNAVWDLDMYNYSGNMLSSIGGGHSSGAVRPPNPIASALGGAMTGAAAGTMVSPGWGTAIGGVIGGVSGLISAM